MHGLLHLYRCSDYCRDIVVLVAEETPASYLEYLRARTYLVIRTGGDHFGLWAALEVLLRRFGAQVIVSDSGEQLNTALLEAGLVKTLNLLLAPVVADRGATRLFESLETKRDDFVLEQADRRRGRRVHPPHLPYRVKR